MTNLLMLVIIAALWGWLLQRIAEHRGRPTLTTAYPALVQQPYLSLCIVGVAVAALAIWTAL